MADFLSYLWAQLVPTIVAAVSFVASVITIIQTIKNKTKLSRILLIISSAIFIVSVIYLAYKYTPPHDFNSSSVGGTISVSDTSVADADSEGTQKPTISPDYNNQTPAIGSDNNSTASHVEPPSANTKEGSATATDKGIGLTNDNTSDSTTVIDNDVSASNVGGDNFPNNNTSTHVIESTGSTIENEDTETTVINRDNGTSVINYGDRNINIIDSNIFNKIEPTPPVVTVTKVTLDRKSADLYIDEDLHLTATVFYSNNESTKNGSAVKWESSNTSIADVDQNGYVSLHAPGTAEITAQASINNSTQSDTCFVTVKERIGPPSGYSISLSSTKTTIGSQFVIYITPYEDNYTQILVHAESPSGAIDTYPWAEGKRYYIDTETGTWKISATIVNEAGRYEAHSPEDYAIIEIAPISFDSYIPDNILP